MYTLRHYLFAAILLANAGATRLSLSEKLYGTEFPGEQFKSADLVHILYKDTFQMQQRVRFSGASERPTSCISRPFAPRFCHKKSDWNVTFSLASRTFWVRILFCSKRNVFANNGLIIPCYPVSFGGAVSLFLGCSVWKVIRLSYILILKFAQFVEYIHHRMINTTNRMQWIE